MTGHPHFISCDWGTSSFRLRLVDTARLAVLCELRESIGIKTLLNSIPEGARSDSNTRGSAFADFLGKKIGELTRGRPGESGSPIIVSGMASSSVGWLEVPYAEVPFRLDGSDARKAVLQLRAGSDAEHPVYLVSGVRSETEMMRGEETEILGLFASPEWAAFAGSCVVILPGTHSKHVFVRRRMVERIQTYMTGELFEVLAEHSLLRMSIGSGGSGMALANASSEDDAAFLEGVRLAAEQGLPGSLFRTRTRNVLHGKPPDENRRFLSGLLVGSEVAALLERAAEDLVVLAASPGFVTSYRAAFAALGAADRLRIAGEKAGGSWAVRGHALLLDVFSNGSQA